MSNEELMKPRFKVIVDYPGSEFKIGQIISLSEIYPYSGYSYELADGRVVAPQFFEPYPTIFKSLEWWEDRAVEDLPQYVKVETDCTCLTRGEVYEAFNWWIDGSFSVLIGQDSVDLWADDFLPATLADYTAYNNQKTTEI